MSTASTQTRSHPTLPANVIDVDEVEWVDTAPPGFDPKIAEAWAEFALHYPAIAAELFDDDPELTTLDTSRSIGRH